MRYSEEDVVEMQVRDRGDTRGYSGDTVEIQGRYRGDIAAVCVGLAQCKLLGLG